MTSELQPRHVAVVMDGNGRWAESRGLARVEGHRAGAQAAKQLIRNVCDVEAVDYLTLYAFSKENWQRDSDEIQGLIKLFSEVINQDQSDFDALGIGFRSIGQLEDFPSGLGAKVHQLERKFPTDAAGVRLHVSLALSYGSQQDIVCAARRLAAEAATGAVDPDAIDHRAFVGMLSTATMPPVDLLIRAGGEMRLSNFLLWELAYAELYFTTCLWPDFSQQHFHAALDAYRRRTRRFGKAGDDQ